MGGGLLNIISYGNQNIILNGNPSKTFFKTVYAKYTNFGLQKFRIDFEGQRDLKLNEDTHLTFKLPRHGELLMDAFLVLNLPDIWSPMVPPSNNRDCWKPYEFDQAIPCHQRCNAGQRRRHARAHPQKKPTERAPGC